MPSGDCLWLARPALGVHQERSCLHVVASLMHDRCADYTTPHASSGVAVRCRHATPHSTQDIRQSSDPSEHIFPPGARRCDANRAMTTCGHRVP